MSLSARNSFNEASLFDNLALAYDNWLLNSRGHLNPLPEAGNSGTSGIISERSVTRYWFDVNHSREAKSASGYYYNRVIRIWQTLMR